MLYLKYDTATVCFSVLIVADQMLIARLKELCEIALSNNLNLRNASHLMQFAATYHAEQLQQCCMQYISLNLPAILEMRYTLFNVKFYIKESILFGSDFLCQGICRS